jgi:hypothetical protein
MGYIFKRRVKEATWAFDHLYATLERQINDANAQQNTAKQTWDIVLLKRAAARKQRLDEILTQLDQLEHEWACVNDDEQRAQQAADEAAAKRAEEQADGQADELG